MRNGLIGACITIVLLLIGYAGGRLAYVLVGDAPKISYCTPAPGQCAYDGAGVYCLLPAEKISPRYGEKK